MSSIVWRLSQGGHLLEIFQVDPATRKMTLLLPLKCSKPMTEEAARKYVENNYPKGGSSVVLAAETLGLTTKRRQ